MKIGVLSDTHIPKKAREIPKEAIKKLNGVEHIFHAGDIQDIEVLIALERLAPVTAVAGNTDTEEIKDKLERKAVITLDEIVFGITHGDGHGKTTIDRAIATFANDMVDCIVFGHSHIPFIEIRNDVLLFNPGSPTDKRHQPRYSIGILETSQGNVNGSIIYF